MDDSNNAPQNNDTPESKSISESSSIPVLFWNIWLREKPVIMQAKVLFGTVATILVVVTAIVTFLMTWAVKDELDSHEIAALEATIKTKESLIELQEAKISELSGDNSILKAKTAGARIEITPRRKRFDLKRPSFDIWFENTGNAPASSVVKVSTGVITEKKLTEKEINSFYDKLYQSLETHSVSPMDNQMWPDKVEWATMGATIGTGTAQDIQNGKSRMYLFLVVAYADANGASKDLKYTEACYYTFQNQAIHNCSQRNRILPEGRR